MPSEPITISEGRPGPLDKLLSIFATVRPGEGVTSLLLAVNVFLLLASYYLLKTIREPLILGEGGAEIKSYAAAGQAILLLGVVPAYGAFAASVNRIRLIGWVTLFFIVNLVIFYAFGTAGAHVGIVFFLWVGIFNVLVIAQFWSFANDLFTEDQGKRLFPIVGVGSTLGAWVGSKAASELFAIFDPAAAPYRLMLIAAAGLGACILLSNIINTRSARTADSRQAEKAAKPLGKEGGFKLVFSNRYLLLIAFLILLLNVVNTTGEFILGKVVTEQTTEAVAAQQLAPEQQEAEIKQRIGVFYGDFFSYVNLLTFLMQSFLVSRLFKWIGVRGALFILPCIALGSYSLILTVPILGIIRIAKILENSTDYSIMNTTRHALFLPTSREAKYKAKAAIDTFFWRVGDMLQAGIVFVGTSLAFGTSQFALVNVCFVVIWLVIVVAIRREHKKISAEKTALPAAA